MIKKIDLIQPFLHITLSDKISNELSVNTPAHMFIYEFSKIDSSDTQLKFIPSPYCEWIIGYNDSADDSYFYCIGPSSKINEIKLKPYSHYFCIRFDDDVFYFNKNMSSEITPSGLLNNIFEYSPAKNTYEYSLIEELCCNQNFNSRINAFNNYLNNSKDMYIIANNVQTIASSIKNVYGCISVSELSQKYGYSERHINRLFTSVFGYGPKDYCKFIRFQKVLDELLSNPERSNSEFIQNIGYSDQAHFQREFKQFMGITPRQYIKLYNSDFKPNKN